jgi:flagellar hook-length control protein FliK
MRPPTITPPTARVDAPRSSPPPGSSPGGFAALLDQTTARTAAAEGPQTRPARTEPSSRRHEDASPYGDATTAAEQATGAEQATAAEASAATPPAQPTAAAERPAATGGDDAAGNASKPDSPPTLYTATDATAMGAAVLPGLVDPTAAAAVPGAAGPGLAAVPVAAQPVAVSGAPTPGAPLSVGQPLAAPADGSPAGGLVVPAELIAAKTDADAKGSGEKGEREQAPDLSQLLAPSPDDTGAATPSAATPNAAPAAAPAADPTVATAPAPAAPASPTTNPVAPSATPFAAGPVATPQLTRASITAAAEHVQDLVRISATRNGGARATLQLKPVELGAVDVHLRTTREGLVATIAAHDQVGLDALQQAGGELRRSLEDRGVQLHRLDLQLGSGQSGFGNGADAREASSGSRRGAAADLGTADDPTEHELSTTTVTSTPAGVLVDVQA